MLEIDNEQGRLLLNGVTVAPLPLKSLTTALEISGVNYDHCTANKDWPSIGFLTDFYNKEFSVVCTFRGGILRDIFLSWHGGKSGSMGYEVPEEALRADQRALLLFLENIFHRPPDDANDHLANFYFSWGCVTANYSIRSLTVGIGITWTSQ